MRTAWPARRRAITGFAQTCLLVFAVARGAGAAIAVLYPQADAPYRQIFADIVTGIERGMGTEPVHARELSAVPDAAAVRRWLEDQSPSAVITLGRVATEIYEKIGLPFPQVVGALDVSPQTRPNVAGVSLAVDPALLFATLKQLAPARQRVWPASCLNRNCRAPASRCSALASACWRRSTVSVSGSAAAAPASAL
ncbi:MAG: hypothetical protein WBE39_01620 [Candidatus Competibacter sp.]